MDVLVVDDQEDVRLLLELYLKGRGHGVVATASSAEARAALASGSVDVLLVDVGLPDVEGPALVEQLRDEGLLPSHVVLMSGLLAGTLADLAAAAGAVPLHKPFEVDDLDALFAGLADG